MARPRKNPVLHVEGAEELNEALRSVGERAGGILLQHAAEAGAEIIAEDARERAPEDEGDLKKGIGYRTRRRQAGRTIVEIGNGRAEWWGKLVELGTSKTPAKPWLRPALDGKASEARDAVAAKLRELLRDVLR